MKAAMIGLGMVSGTYADAFAKTSAAELTLIYSRTPERRRAYLDKWPGPDEAESAHQIAASDVDFVVLTTPPNARMEVVEILADAGKPILMEKPVERSLSAATALVELCESRSVPLGIMLQHRARPIVRDLRTTMAGLGPMFAAEVNVPWWRPQSYYDEPGRGTYDRDGGGVLISQAIHTLDLMLSLTGPVAEVTAMTATTGFHAMESEDFVCAGLRFENGTVGNLFASTASYPGSGETITLHFEGGSARMDAGELVITRKDGTREAFGKSAASGAGTDPMAFTSDWHRLVIEDFSEAIAEGRAPLATGRSALSVHRLIAALEESGRRRSMIRVAEVT